MFFLTCFPPCIKPPSWTSVDPSGLLDHVLLYALFYILMLHL